MPPTPFETRDRLVLEHLGLVEQIARKLLTRLPPCFELDDLIQAGRIGLLRAASVYDQAAHHEAGFDNAGPPFGAFARRRIKGEMMDSIGMHSAEGAPRTTRRRRWDEATRPPIAEYRESDKDRDENHDKPTTPDPAARADALIEQRERNDMIAAGLRTLPPRQAKVISIHYGADDSTLREIARKGTVGRIGSARISQLHNAGLRGMREFYARRGIAA